MDTKKKHFIDRANEIGILLVRERNSEEDYTGWGALEFVLNNGEVFVISGEEFGQGKGENGIWVDFNEFDSETIDKIKKQASEFKRKQKESTISAWLKYQRFEIE